MAIPSKVVTDLLIGPIEFCSIKSKLKIYGITDIIHINSKPEIVYEPDFKYYPHQITEINIEACDIIAEQSAKGLEYGKVIICCKDGNVWAPLMAACFLIKFKGMQVKAAVDLIKSQRGSSQLEQYMKFLEEYQKHSQK